MKVLMTPLNEKELETLQSGDQVLLTGIIYTARDAAHKRFIEAIDKKEPLPFDLKNNVIYFVGPTPSKNDEVIGSCGPTTSYRMDDYSPVLLDLGLKGMIGKGKRNQKVIDSIVKNKAIYFGAIGGLGAYLKQCVKSSKIIAYEDLDTEAVRELYVENFPLTVIIDTKGSNLYERGTYETQSL